MFFLASVETDRELPDFNQKSTYNIYCKCFFMFKAEFTLQNCKVCCCFKLFTFYFIYAIIKLLITKSVPSDLCLVLRIIK